MLSPSSLTVKLQGRRITKWRRGWGRLKTSRSALDTQMHLTWKGWKWWLPTQMDTWVDTMIIELWMLNSPVIWKPASPWGVPELSFRDKVFLPTCHPVDTKVSNSCCKLEQLPVSSYLLNPGSFLHPEDGQWSLLSSSPFLRYNWQMNLCKLKALSMVNGYLYIIKWQLWSD